MPAIRSLGRDDLSGVLAAVLVVNLVGSAPAALGGPGTAWFQSLTKPALFPPPWLFGVVWPALFTLLGAALYLVWRTDGPRRFALGLFGAQMAVNVVWTPVFFGAQNLALALGVVVLLLVLAVTTAVAFLRVDRTAGLLLVPYVLCTAFAALLNYRFLAVN